DKSYDDSIIQESINGQLCTIKISSNKTSSSRILGGYFNTHDSVSYIILKLKNITSFTCNLIRRKHITHDHVIYIINKVILPKLEYISQTTFLTEAICDRILSLLKSFTRTFSFSKIHA